MLDFLHLPVPNNADIQVFTGSSPSGGSWKVWNKPRGCSMIYIFVLGSGGGGGTGAVGAASTAAGGGGGGSGGQTTVMLPAAFVGDRLYVSAGAGIVGAGNASYVSMHQWGIGSQFDPVLAYANGGTVGGNASGNTAGSAGAGAGAASTTSMPRAGWGVYNILAGQNGIIGATSAGNGAALTLPATGLVVTGGTGGGALNTTTGRSGGNFSVGGIFPPHAGGLGSTVTGTPGDNGSNGFNNFNGMQYAYGGTGGGGGYANSGGAGGIGGAGGYGSGGGGGGGGFTGSTAAAGGRGGDGLVIIAAW